MQRTLAKTGRPVRTMSTRSPAHAEVDSAAGSVRPMITTALPVLASMEEPALTESTVIR